MTVKSKWVRPTATAAAVAHTIPAEQTEIDAYLANRHPFTPTSRKGKAKEGTMPGDTVLGWWRSHEAIYPTLAKIARFYLSAPGSTSEAERVFSRAGRYVSGRRALGPTSLQQLVVTSALASQGFKMTPVVARSPLSQRVGPSLSKAS